ncbi:helix-turn-helix transcriptional regulator [bacterium]|nr:helix-turn-helix transcriptional regulator [bacterium]
MSSDVREKFANKLKNIRNERSLSQENLALLCGIDRTYIGRLERLERNPSLEILQKIADGLNIKLYDLLKFD